ncbi:MAG TPA: prenyltransferase/squalene oxidase repeat-containing protein [Planctomycetota bacterium]|nr:prenyltransferase/squalene oxidase repeat-containing protein [Planctomycetota bacterium]
MSDRSLVALLVCILPGLSQAQATEPRRPPIDGKATVEAMNAGIGWLVRHQDENGGWSASEFQRHDPKTDLCTGTGKPDQDLPVTAWATLALLARGNTEREGEHREALLKALRWLETQMQVDGFVGAPEAGNAVVAHALSCCVMVAVKSSSNQPPPQQSLERLVALRLPSGTWPAQPGETKGDAMATFWASLACSIGTALGGGRMDLEPTLSAMERGDLAMPSPALEATLRIYAQRGPKTDARLVELMDSLGKQVPRWRDGPDATGMDFLDWHSGTFAMIGAGDTAWVKWYQSLREALVVHQRTDGAHAGSWDPVDRNGKQGGRVYATAVNVLSLSLGQSVGGDSPVGAKK